LSIVGGVVVLFVCIAHSALQKRNSRHDCPLYLINKKARLPLEIMVAGGLSIPHISGERKGNVWKRL